MGPFVTASVLGVLHLVRHVNLSVSVLIPSQRWVCPDSVVERGTKGTYALKPTVGQTSRPTEWTNCTWQLSGNTTICRRFLVLKQVSTRSSPCPLYSPAEHVSQLTELINWTHKQLYQYTRVNHEPRPHGNTSTTISPQSSTAGTCAASCCHRSHQLLAWANVSPKTFHIEKTSWRAYFGYPIIIDYSSLSSGFFLYHCFKL